MNHWVEQAKIGDRGAREVLVRALRPRIVRMAAYYARRSGEDADDLGQEAWLGLLEALPEVDLSIGSPDQFLIRRARWRLLDAIKRNRRRRRGQLLVPLDEAAAESAAGRDTAVGDASVREFADQLKATQRAVLRGLLAGLTWREVGSALGCTSANVAYHVRQIRRRYEEWQR
jgi:RNA polymerase sigma factor (sigma-70 family)